MQVKQCNTDFPTLLRQEEGVYESNTVSVNYKWLLPTEPDAFHTTRVFKVSFWDEISHGLHFIRCQ